MNIRHFCSSAALIASSVIGAPVLATPPSGISVETVVNGSFGQLNVSPSEKSGKWDMLLRTKTDTDVGADDIVLQGGGSTGWHSHPATVFVTVLSGSIVWYDGGDPVCPGHSYTAGQSFIESANVVHNAVNGSPSAQAEFMAVRMNPTGVPFVNDENKPTNCS
jgi:quercetin dioxygenase-like cupin family protein